MQFVIPISNQLMHFKIIFYRMKYDPDTNEFTNKYDGVTIEVPGFGETRTVEYLTTNSKLVPYMKEFVEYFVARGYERGRSIRAAPYDWRLAGGTE